MASRLRTLIEGFRGLRVMVVGDAMTDRYSFGRIERLSQEAPVPVFLEDRQEERDGGAANVRSNLAALGCEVTIHFPPVRCLKHRFFAGHHQVFRIDKDRECRPQQREVEDAVTRLRAKRIQVLVLSDYAKGWVSEKMATTLITVARHAGIPVVIDPKGSDWAKYQGATVICPNATEYQVAKSSAYRTDMAILLKKGPQGATLMQYDKHQDSWDLNAIPARARHVYDVTGAGDTVVAVMAAALGLGGTLLEGAELAMLAAGHVVGEVGTAVCQPQILIGLVARFGLDKAMEGYEEPKEAAPEAS